MSTIKDVAKRANVSVTTVSRVLNNNGYVHQDTKRIIEEAMNELKYAPNIFAEGLSRGTTSTIGLIINYITDSNSSKLVDLIEIECHKKRFKTLIGITRESKAMENYYYTLFKKYNIDGIIIADKVSNMDNFLSLNKPTITIDHTINNDIASINVDYKKDFDLVINNFIAEQRKNVLIFTYKNKNKQNETEMLISLLNNNGISTKLFELDEEFNKDELQEQLSSISFDGIYITCDILTISIVSILHKLRIKIPEACSIVGSSKTSLSTIISPPLTTIEYPVEKICTKAFDFIYNNITENNSTIIHETIESNLIKRESTK